MNVNEHKNVENVIRYFLLFLPPRGRRSILDIGSGVTCPYRGVLEGHYVDGVYQGRLGIGGKYRAIDIRGAPPKVDYVMDIVLDDEKKSISGAIKKDKLLSANYKKYKSKTLKYPNDKEALVDFYDKFDKQIDKL